MVRTQNSNPIFFARALAIIFGLLLVGGFSSVFSQDNSAVKDSGPTKLNEIYIEKRPLKDLVPLVKEKLKAGMVLDAPFVIEATIVVKNSRTSPVTFTRAEGADQNLIDVVKSFVQAINDSGYLGYLEQLSGQTLTLQITQDAANVSVVMQSEMVTETRAKSVTRLLDLLLKSSLSDKENKLKELQARLAQSPDNEELKNEIAEDSDDLEIVKYATVGHEGKNLVIKSEIPQEVAQRLIKRKLNEASVEESKKPDM